MICIEGNIGAGKSTILQKLHDEHKYLICLEPVENWKPYLKRIYEDDEGYYEFQVKVWSDRSFIQEKTDRNMLYERSPHFTMNTFVECMKMTKKITNEEYDNLKKMYENTDNKWKPKKHIYIKVSPETSYERIKTRSREHEHKITKEYLTMLHDLYENAYKEAKEKGIDVIVINGEQEVDEIVKDILKEIQ
tara:strand:- start:39317 stop:39889 length:573 start_codon:yes stop_codon:yes gene_type:complete